jgi:hypothetical protein
MYKHRMPELIAFRYQFHRRRTEEAIKSRILKLRKSALSGPRSRPSASNTWYWEHDASLVRGVDLSVEHYDWVDLDKLVVLPMFSTWTGDDLRDRWIELFGETIFTFTRENRPAEEPWTAQEDDILIHMMRDGVHRRTEAIRSHSLIAQRDLGSVIRRIVYLENNKSHRAQPKTE